MEDTSVFLLLRMYVVISNLILIFEGGMGWGITSLPYVGEEKGYKALSLRHALIMLSSMNLAHILPM